MWAAFAAGLGAGVCAFNGLYPQFDGGSLRLVLALTSGPFAAAVVAASLSSKSAAGAFGRAVFLSVVLGVASTLLPAALLTFGSHGSGGGYFLLGTFFGVMFGVPTGAIYGIPLAILSAMTHRHVRASSDEATDRARQLAGAWLAIVCLFAFLVSGLMGSMHFIGEAQPSALLLALVVLLLALGVMAHAWARVRRRGAWLARVRGGFEPAFRVRAAEPRDPVDALPRLGDGKAVLEWLPTDFDAASAVYRLPAAGVAVAIVSDR